MYRVKYDTLAKLPNGEIGNISMGKGTCYTDVPLGKVEKIIEECLGNKMCIVNEVTQLNGIVIKNPADEE